MIERAKDLNPLILEFQEDLIGLEEDCLRQVLMLSMLKIEKEELQKIKLMH